MELGSVYREEENKSWKAFGEQGEDREESGRKQKLGILK